MPPWHADAPPGTFHDERILTDVERRTIREWVQSGAGRGDTRDLAALPVFTEGWRIGTPDVVFEMPFDYEIKASGTIDYEYIYIPTNFTEAKWVTAIEIRPGNRRAVHHANLYYRANPDSPRVLAKPNLSDRRSSPQRELDTALHSRRDFADRPQRNIAHYAPGTNPQVAPSGTAYRLEAGGLLELQMHYTAIGEVTRDRTRVGIIFSTDPSPRELHAQTFYNTVFTLPAGAPNVSVSTDLEFVADAQLWGLWPHSHLRGKRWKYELVMADGSTTTILSVPNYDFNWQTYYMFAVPLRVPKGAKIVSTAWYDNSAANKHNPDPTVDVTNGKQTWDEMQYTGALLSAPEP